MIAVVSPVMSPTVQSAGMPERSFFIESKAGFTMARWPQAEARTASAPTEMPRVRLLLIMSERLNWIQLGCTAGREEAEYHAYGGRRPQRCCDDDRTYDHHRFRDLGVPVHADPPDRH